MMLNPGSGCGCCGNQVLIWNEKPQYYDSGQSLVNFYAQHGIHTDVYGIGGNISYPTNLDQYNMIFIPMPLQCSILFPVSPSSLLQKFYNRGGNRIIITGEYGPYWDDCSVFANSMISALGFSASCSTGQLYVYGTCTANSGVPKSGNVQNSSLVMKGVTTIGTDATGTISGGIPLLVDPSNDWCVYYPQPSPISPCTSSIPIVSCGTPPKGGCEVLLTQDENIFYAYCQALFDMNTKFLINSATLFY